MQYKKIIVRILFITCLLIWGMNIFHGKPANALWAMAWLYFCIPLVSLALTPVTKSYLKIFFVLTTGLLLLLSRGSVLHILWTAVFVGGILYCVLRHKQLLDQRKHITTWAVASIHGSVFCMVCAIAGTLSVYVAGKEFSITCDQVREVVNQNMSTILTPLRFTTDQIDFIQAWTDKFFTKSTDDLIQQQVGNQLMWGLGWWLGGWISSQLISQLPAWLSAALGPNPEEAINNAIQTEYAEYPAPAKNPLAQKMQEKQRSRLANTTFAPLQDKQDLDNKICHVVFDQLKERSTKPGFRISIIISLFLFLYPIIRLFAYILSGIISVLYMFLKSIWFISVVPEERIVETWLVGDGYQANTILSTLSFEAKTKRQAERQAAKNAMETSHIRCEEIWANLTHIPEPTYTPPPKESDINSILSDTDIQNTKWWKKWWGWTSGSDIIVANSPQDQDSWQEPPKPSSPKIDFGSIGWNFGKKL